MNQFIIRSFSPLLVLLVMLSSADVFARENIDQSDSIFKFQQTLANKGNGFAQYKLGTMYESGIGVAKDIEQAKIWYQEAATKGVKAASDRGIFLTVRDKGFNKSEHEAWLAGVKADAEKRNIESMLLLGQIYHKGIGVKKNLEKSLALLTYVNSSGDANVEQEIKLIQKEMQTNTATTLSQQMVTHKSSVTNNSKVNLARENAIAEKRRKYEQVMAKIELEQRKINEQQASVTGGEIVAIDDEF